MLTTILIWILIISLSYKIITSIYIFICEEKRKKKNIDTTECDYLSDDGLSCENYFGQKYYESDDNGCKEKCPYKDVEVTEENNEKTLLTQLHCRKFFRRLDRIMSLLPEISASMLIIFNILKK